MQVNKDFLCHFGELHIRSSPGDLGTRQHPHSFSPFRGWGRSNQQGLDLSFLPRHCAAARQRPRAGHCEPRRKQSARLRITLPCAELLGQDNNVPLFAWGSKLRFGPSHLLFLCSNLGINLFVRTAAENQLVKGTERVTNAGISFEEICTDDTLRYSTSSA